MSSSIDLSHEPLFDFLQDDVNQVFLEKTSLGSKRVVEPEYDDLGYDYDPEDPFQARLSLQGEPSIDPLSVNQPNPFDDPFQASVYERAVQEPSPPPVLKKKRKNEWMDETITLTDQELVQMKESFQSRLQRYEKQAFMRELKQAQKVQMNQILEHDFFSDWPIQMNALVRPVQEMSPPPEVGRDVEQQRFQDMPWHAPSAPGSSISSVSKRRYSLDTPIKPQMNVEVEYELPEPDYEYDSGYLPDVQLEEFNVPMVNESPLNQEASSFLHYAKQIKERSQTTQVYLADIILDNNRSIAAQAFYNVLVLANQGLIKAHQSMPFAPIHFTC